MQRAQTNFEIAEQRGLLHSQFSLGFRFVFACVKLRVLN